MVKKASPTTQTHHVRTFFAAVAGIIAVYLVLASVTVVWLNRTLTDTNTYVGTVAPLVDQPAIQDFLAQKATDQLMSSSPDPAFIASLLPASDLDGSKTPAQIQALLAPVIKANVLKIVSSPQFATLWKTTNQAAQASLIAQLNNSTGEITLNFSPAIASVIGELGTTQLAPLAAKVNLAPTAGVVTIKSSNISQIHRSYRLFQEGTVAIVIAAILAALLSIWLSVRHAKTLRRILVGIRVLALLQAAVLAAPTVITTTKVDATTLAAGKVVISGLFHNLELASLVLGLLCIAGAVGSKLYSNYHSAKK